MPGCRIQVKVCDPHHPQQNAFVERYHRTDQAECLALDRPKTIEQARLFTDTFVQHSNVERPNQALTCGNQPPRSAFATLPTLPPLPAMVDPDAWLAQLDGLHLERKVDRNGTVSLDLKRYYVSAQLVGHRVILQLDAKQRCVHVFLEQHLIRVLAPQGHGRAFARL